MFQRIPIYASAINCTWVEQRHIGEIILRNGPHKETELPCGNRLGDEFVSNLSLLLFSPLVSPPHSPWSFFGDREKSIWPRCSSENDVDTLGKAWKLACRTFRHSYKVFVLRLCIREKIKREKERKGGLPSRIEIYSFVRIWISPFSRLLSEMFAIFCAGTSTYLYSEKFNFSLDHDIEI